MNAFLKKEWDQWFLTNKWLIFFVVFVAIGIMNPFTAKITPTLIENLVGDEMASFMGDPTAIDSWLQFFKNVPQIGLIAFILMMANTMSKELQEGTLPIFLAKGLRRRDVIMAKWLFHTFMWTIGYIVAIGVTYGYTIYYWDQSIVQQLPLALLGIYVFGLMFISTTLFGNTVTNSTMGGLAVSGILLAIIVFVHTFFDWKWNPLQLFSMLEERLTENASFSYMEPLLFMGIMIIITIIGSILHFNRRTL